MAQDSSAFVFPAKAGIYCVPRMALNLEVKVLFGPQGAEPLAKGNCVAAMRGGEEAGGKSGSRRTDIGYKACPCEGRGPVRWGNPAMDGDARYSFCHAHG